MILRALTLVFLAFGASADLAAASSVPDPGVSAKITNGNAVVIWNSPVASPANVEHSADLAGWTTVSTNNSSGSFQHAFGNSPRGFYRLKWIPKVPPTPAMITVQGETLPEASDLTGTVVATFRIGNLEVTLDEWREVRSWGLTNGYTDLAQGDALAGNHPVQYVNWYNAAKWCNARSEKEGLTPVYRLSGAIYRTGESEPTLNAAANGYRLPSETEWEWAARGGVMSKGYIYSGSNDVNAVAVYQESGGVVPYYKISSGISRGPWPVGCKEPNELGIHDMSGNVHEWFGARDGWLTPDTGNLRGGFWSGSAANCLIHVSGWVDPVIGLNTVGLRVARNAP